MRGWLGAERGRGAAGDAVNAGAFRDVVWVERQPGLSVRLRSADFVGKKRPEFQHKRGWGGEKVGPWPTCDFYVLWD